jgi:hypothetical protein
MLHQLEKLLLKHMTVCLNTHGKVDRMRPWTTSYWRGKDRRRSGRYSNTVRPSYKSYALALSQLVGLGGAEEEKEERGQASLWIQFHWNWWPVRKF